MDAHEGGVRQPLLEFLHAHEHHHGAVSADEVDLQILAHALHATDVGDRHAHHLVLRLEEDVVVLVYLRRAGGSCFLLVEQVILAVDTLGSLLKLFEAEGLEKIVVRIDLVALDGILAVGGGEDDQRARVEGTHEVQAVEVGHADVAEDGVNGLLLHQRVGVDGALAFADQFQVGYLFDIGGQLLQGERLVVNG